MGITYTFSAVVEPTTTEGMSPPSAARPEMLVNVDGSSRTNGLPVSTYAVADVPPTVICAGMRFVT